MWEFFQNLSRKFKFYQSLTSTTDTLHKTKTSLWTYLARSEKKSCRENQNKNQNQNTFHVKKIFLLHRAFYDDVAKYCGAAGHASDENTAQVHGMLDT
jgi:hypothetical protein